MFGPKIKNGNGNGYKAGRLNVQPVNDSLNQGDGNNYSIFPLSQEAYQAANRPIDPERVILDKDAGEIADIRELISFLTETSE